MRAAAAGLLSLGILYTTSGAARLPVDADSAHFSSTQNVARVRFEHVALATELRNIGGVDGVATHLL